MNRRQREEGPLRVLRRVVALVVAGAVGRALWYAAVDAFVLYVFGDPAPERRAPSPSAGAAPRSSGAGRDAERLVA